MFITELKLRGFDLCHIHAKKKTSDENTLKMYQ